MHACACSREPENREKTNKTKQNKTKQNKTPLRRKVRKTHLSTAVILRPVEGSNGLVWRDEVIKLRLLVHARYTGDISQPLWPVAHLIPRTAYCELRKVGHL